MRRVAWRPVFLAVCAIAALATSAATIDAIGVGAPPWAGRFGLSFDVSTKPFNLEVSSIDPSGPAARAGLRQGDLVEMRANSLVERFWLLYRPLNGRAMSLLVQRGSLQKRITFVPPRDTYSNLVLLAWFGNLWLLLFAAVIAWRRAHVPQMRLLALALAIFALGSTAGSNNWAAPWAWIYVVSATLSVFAFPLVVALWAIFAGSFAQPLSLSRRIAQWLCCVLVGVAVAIGAAGIIGVMTLRFDPVGFWFAPVWSIPYWFATLSALVCSMLAVASSRGIDRQRAAWSLGPLALVFFAIPVVDGVLPALSLSYAGITVVYDITNLLAFFVVPAALTYAALSHRLIDIGFVLNRALIFGIVSAIVIGAFILVEWAASAWLMGATHTTSAVIGMIVALALGLSLRYIHKYVDRFVDRVFFRKRHENETALRRFAHESSYITDRSTLLDRAVREVKDHTNAADVSILVPNGTQTYEAVAATNGARGVIDENDPALVAMRAWHKSVDLHRIAGSALCGEFAFPMVSRGALIGTLVCGAKRDGEAYAPDESDALATLAHGVGAALDALSPRTDTSIESVRETLALLLEELRALPGKINGVRFSRGTGR